MPTNNEMWSNTMAKCNLNDVQRVFDKYVKLEEATFIFNGDMNLGVSDRNGPDKKNFWLFMEGLGMTDLIILNTKVRANEKANSKDVLIANKNIKFNVCMKRPIDYPKNYMGATRNSNCYDFLFKL